MTHPIRVSEEVSDAVMAGRPVVALESTIVTHGLPRPRNVQVAAQGERAARELGVVPATIGVVDGVGVVGLSSDEIERLASDDQVSKASVRDLPVCAALRLNAGTTIAATTVLARRAGISVFSTGGLGGVHHNASATFDESADLVTLAHEPIVLVSSGAKAILDIPATLERFETLSVPVVGYQTLDYPGFYVRSSGHRLTSRIDTPEQAAEIYRASRALDLPASLLVANPIPEADSLDPGELDAVIEQAWAAAEADHISGQATTPYLLDHIRRATGDRSLEANVALYLNNVRLGARIAIALASA